MQANSGSSSKFMADHRSANIRNFAIVGHASSGKTLLSEAMLACSGAINRMGRIADGTTVSDYHVSEKQRQISTQTSLLHATWMDKKFNIMDTPGYLDFMSEALAALHVADFALVTSTRNTALALAPSAFRISPMSAASRRSSSSTRWTNKTRTSINLLADARTQYGPRVFPLNVPVNPGPDFNQILDVLRSDIVTYETTGRGHYTEEPAQGSWKERVIQLHRELIELIAESDDALLTKFFDQGGLSEEEFRSGIHAAVQQQHFIPLFCISAETDVGVARLMDFIAKYGSSPVDRAKVAALDGYGNEVEVALTSSEPVAQVFKTMNEEHFGELSFFRVYSGTVRTGMELYNSTRGITERIGQIYLLNGRDRTAVGELAPATSAPPSSSKTRTPATRSAWPAGP